MSELLKLNLGASDRRIEGFVSVDIAPPADIVCDLEGPWPWDTSSVSEVRAHDIFEHIGDCSHVDTWICSRCKRARQSGDLFTGLAAIYAPERHPLGRIHAMNELHRVLVPGGLALIEVPDAAHGAGFAQDPTHKTPWTRNSFQYYGAGPGGEFAHGRLAKAYGITAKFELVGEIEHREYQDTFDKVWKITALLRAVK